MTTLFVAALAVGGLGILAWVVMTAVASSTDGATTDPEQRWGTPGRLIIAALFGAGLAGLSATYAGWSAPLSLVASLLGGGALAWLSTLLGPQTSE